jgi:hypothetical protein
MIAVQNLFDAHLTIVDLDSAIRFYRDAVDRELIHCASPSPASRANEGDDDRR